MTTSANNNRPDGVTLIAVLHFITGGIGVLVALGLFLFGIAAVFFMPSGNGNGGGVVVALFLLGALLVGVCSVLSIVAGVGLLRLRNWARWVALILAILSLPAFPIGTVIGGLVLWYLLQENVAVLFEKRATLPAAQAAQPAAPVAQAMMAAPAAPAAPAEPELPMPEEPEVTKPEEPQVPPAE